MKKLNNVHYEFTNSYNDKLKEVVANFTLDGVPHRYFIFLQKKGKEKDAYYLKEAKKKFNEDYKSGKVIRSTKIDHSKPWLIAGVSVFGVAAIALGGFLTYKYLNGGFGGGTYQPGQQVEVKPVVEDPSGGNYKVTFGNNEAKVGEKYHTSITLTPKNPSNDDYVLPDKLVSVISNTTALKEEQYKYTLGENKTTAELDVEGEFVYGPVTVSLVLVSTSQPGPGPEPGVWVNTDLDGVLSNRDHILAVTETQSPLNLIQQVLNAKQFIIEKRSYVDYGPVNEGQLLVRYYIDTDAMYIKKEETDMKFPSDPPEVSYLIYDEQVLSSYKAVYYCYEEEESKKSELIYESDDVASAKDKLNLLYLNSMLSSLVCSHARLFVDPIFETNYYGYSLDYETGKARDNLVKNIDSYKSTWETFEDVPEMTYQKMDNTSIKVENEKSKHVEFEGDEYDVTTKFDLFIKDGLLIDYANNMELIISAQSMKQTVYDESSLEAESFTLDNLEEYFSGE